MNSDEVELNKIWRQYIKWKSKQVILRREVKRSYDPEYNRVMPLQLRKMLIKWRSSMSNQGNISNKIDELYNPSIQDLELNEHQGKERPVVYLDEVLPLLEESNQEARLELINKVKDIPIRTHDGSYMLDDNTMKVGLDTVLLEDVITILTEAFKKEKE